MFHHRSFRRFGWVAAVLCAAIFSSCALADLQPDQILLITNKNNPDSAKLAQMYCQLRGVPADQTIALDLPNNEEMPFSIYETHVVAPVREFLEVHPLRDKIKCLLTFYGVPFRILDKQNTLAEDQELGDLRTEEQTLTEQLERVTSDLESHAAAVDPLFRPGAGDSMEALLARGQAARSAISSAIPTMANPAAQHGQLEYLVSSIVKTGGIIEADKIIGPSQRSPQAPEKQRETWEHIHQQASDVQTMMLRLENSRWDADARKQLRQVAEASSGLVGAIRVIDAEIGYLTPTATASATDNELSLLWWNYYPRQRWLANPLDLHYTNPPPPTMMVMRLDGPDPASVRRIMQNSVKVEAAGLRGTVAIDARGIEPVDDKGNANAYGQFDQKLRNLAYMLRMKTNLKVKFDDQEPVFPPHSVKNVALYVGWYSVNQYVPGCDFVPGAVGYHIASFELSTLHSPSTHWVRGLIKDGVVATLGAVNEPYLAAFPPPDEFFPLLLTGKLSLAEVYWKTTPMTSWMICFIGDPLYRPYLHDPALSIDNLPAYLQRAFPDRAVALPDGLLDSSHINN